MTKPYTKHEQEWILYIYLTPHSSKDSLGPIIERENKFFLKASVTEIPEDNKANKALIKLLSKCLKIPASLIEVTHGQTSRYKTLLLHQSEVDFSKIL